jgi:peptidoglycan/LPS O-acetylase OafA/YrhL
MHKRLAFIDTLRGIAVLSVVLQHALEQIVQSNTTGEYYSAFHGAIGHYFNFGRFGVVLFFFVSGFVIPFSFPNSPTPIRDFAISRFFRLYPTYWLSLLMFILLAPLMNITAIPLSQIAANVTMFQWVLMIPNIRIAYWTLAIELIFYISCIGLFAFGLLNQRLTAFYIVIVAASISIVALPLIKNHNFWALLGIALDLSSMFFGKLIRDTVMGHQLRWRHVAICALFYCMFASSVAFMRFGGAYHDNFFHAYSIGSAYIAAAAMFLLFAAFGERMAWRFMSFVGMISYSVYLMGSYAMVLIIHFFGVGQNPVEWLIFVAGVLAASILVSWPTFIFVEKPFISLGHRFRSRSRPLPALDPSLRGQGAAE